MLISSVFAFEANASTICRSEFTLCTQIAENLNRLECYDALAERKRKAAGPFKRLKPDDPRVVLIRRLIPLQKKYKQVIQRKINRNWVKPPGTSGKIGCDVVITQLPSGVVVDVHVKRCTGGGDSLRRSVEAAVLKSSPLPAAPAPAVFDRTTYLFFRPEGECRSK